MPKEGYGELCKMLWAQGIVLHIVDGKWSIKNQKGGFIGMPPKIRPISVFVGPRPKGSANQEDFNLQSRLALTDNDWTLVYGDTKTILACTHDIDLTQTITRQKRGAVDLAIQKFVALHPKFKPFCNLEAYWSVQVLFMVIFCIKANAAGKQLKKAAQNSMVGQQADSTQAQAASAQAAPLLVQQDNQLVVRAPKKRGRPRKADKAAMKVAMLSRKEPPLAALPPVVAPQPVVASQPVAVSQPVSTSDNDKGEVIDLNLLEDNADTTMGNVTAKFSQVNLNLKMPGDTSMNDQDDGSVFDMAQTTRPPLLACTALSGKLAPLSAAPVSAPVSSGVNTSHASLPPLASLHLPPAAPLGKGTAEAASSPPAVVTATTNTSGLASASGSIAPPTGITLATTAASTIAASTNVP
ncbi:hypothetical protein FRC07_005204, partial [Ceratobasidium sp. 392]